MRVIVDSCQLAAGANLPEKRESTDAKPAYLASVFELNGE
jgi:hypothetical protein